MPGTIDSSADLAVVIAARDEQQRIEATVAALRGAFPGAALWVADDGSTDGTARLAVAAGAKVRSTGRPLGKGGAMTLAVESALAEEPVRTLLLCDGDLGSSADRLTPLARAVASGEADLAIAVFARRVGGGFGLALATGAWLIRRCCGYRAEAPLSGQRALTRAAALAALPFARGFGMEVGMTIDTVRAGARVVELELDLEHRATGRSAAGFVHRGRQLVEIVLAGRARL